MPLSYKVVSLPINLRFNNGAQRWLYREEALSVEVEDSYDALHNVKSDREDLELGLVLGLLLIDAHVNVEEVVVVHHDVLTKRVYLSTKKGLPLVVDELVDT